jgi:hypothetical protein
LASSIDKGMDNYLCCGVNDRDDLKSVRRQVGSWVGGMQSRPILQQFSRLVRPLQPHRAHHWLPGHGYNRRL